MLATSYESICAAQSASGQNDELPEGCFSPTAFISIDLDEASLDALRRRMSELAAPTDSAVVVAIPYDRGDLVSRVHAAGRVQHTEHIGDGTRIKTRVPEALAAALRPFSAS